MRTLKERLESIKRSSILPFTVAPFGAMADIARCVNHVALEARLGWSTLVNGYPGEEWLEVSAHSPEGASDVVVILKQDLTDEYLGSLIMSQVGEAEFKDRVTAIDAHMQKVMAQHNITST